MDKIINDFSISIATVNGSGSQSANNILMRSFFRSGVPVGGKNIFPSNIAGLPTWFSIRVNEKGYLSRSPLADIFVAMNLDTFTEDLKKVKPEGLFIYNEHRKLETSQIPSSLNSVAIPFQKLATEVSPSVQLRKLLVNMVYVGVLSELLNLDFEIVRGVIRHQFKGKDSVFAVNEKAVEAGRGYARDHLSQLKCPYLVEKREKTQNKILLDGNSAGAMGMVSGGATFAAWYPITPSSSLAESFQKYCETSRITKNGEKNFAIIQAEDELSAISMVAGAGWSGARAMTATSGPGISLMAECIGLMYFAEIPGVIWDVQRMGPSTGLPTRTSQGDLLACAYASHGDTQHPVLMPGHPEECFDFAKIAFDLAEGFQTPVFVLSDLDLGMNFWMSEKPKVSTFPLARGKVFRRDDLEKAPEYGRYQDVDGDGVPYRTLPGTPHDLAAYFTRGTGHDPHAKYSEDPDNYEKLLQRLQTKWQTMTEAIPQPVIDNENRDWGLIYFGSTEAIVPELRDLLSREGFDFDVCRIRAFPFHKKIESFLKGHKKIVVIEQNASGQMTQLLRNSFPLFASSLLSLCNFNGLTLSAQEVSHNLKELVHGNK